jgi:hypothetical protein
VHKPGDSKGLEFDYNLAALAGDSKGLEFDYNLAALAGDFKGSENLEWYFRDRILVIFVTRSQHKATK